MNIRELANVKRLITLSVLIVALLTVFGGLVCYEEMGGLIVRMKSFQMFFEHFERFGNVILNRLFG